MQNNSPSALTSKLIAQLEADKAAIAEQTERLLQEHANSFNKLSSAALNTTKTAMGNHLKEVNDLLEQRTKQIRKALAFPFVVFLSLCLLIGLSATGWSLWVVMDANKTVEAAQAKEAETREQIQRLTDQFCATPAGKKNCTGGK